VPQASSRGNRDGDESGSIPQGAEFGEVSNKYSGTEAQCAAAGFEHQPLATGGGPASVELPEMSWVNRMIGNVKNAMRGSYHHASGQHLPRYLAEF